jgi:hypothetical protein
MKKNEIVKIASDYAMLSSAYHELCLLSMKYSIIYPVELNDIIDKMSLELSTSRGLLNKAQNQCSHDWIIFPGMHGKKFTECRICRKVK